MKSLYERMGGAYRQEGDYFVPNLALPDTGAYPLGKYGRMRRRYLREHRPALYSTMALNGTLSQHLAEIDETCHERMKRLCAAMGYDGERHIATVSKQPAQTQAPIADTGYAGFEKQWTVKEKPVTNYGDEKIFTAT